MNVMFKDLLSRIKPANKNYNYMEIKELSEVMEAARNEAAPYVMKYLKAAKDYDRACGLYLIACKNPQKRWGFGHGE